MSLRSLVTCSWLASQIRCPSSTLKIIDATFHLPTSGRNAYDEFMSARIPTASFFDIDAVCDTSSDLPHMLPTQEIFEKAMNELGVTNKCKVVVYDNSDHGVFSAPRLWWMFKCFGHDNVAVLDGGMRRWVKSGFQIDTTEFHPPQESSNSFKCQQFRSDMVLNLDDMKKYSADSSAHILDARPKARFDGTAPEPRQGLKSGHMPHSASLPFDAFLTPGKVLKSRDEIKELFQDRGVDLTNPDKPVVATCGSGVSACAIAFAAHVATDGQLSVPVYDGSWTEWASQHPDTEILTNTSSDNE